MEEAYRLADRVAVVARGEVVALGTPDGLVARTSAGRSVLTFLLPAGSAAPTSPSSTARSRSTSSGSWSVRGR